jgi:prepilin-type N-terminal cleavage/methylation domain-containing protein
MHADSRHNFQRPRGFTIIELLVVIGIIALLAALTTLGARRLTAGSRLAGGTNAVTNALGIARAAAIRDGVATAIVFRPVWDPSRKQIPQRTEMTIVRSTGERIVFGDDDSPLLSMAERWVVVDDVPAITLPEGIKVAGPMYDPPPQAGSPITESTYATQADLKALETCAEVIEFNRVVAVLFGPDGQFLTRPPRSTLGDMKCYVDWNKNGANAGAGQPTFDPQDVNAGNCASGNFEKYWLQDAFEDECNLMFVPYLNVYDDKAARELKGTNWGVVQNMFNELTGPNGYIALYGDRISFNRFSGLPERKVR